jgi:hypothetical protein
VKPGSRAEFNFEQDVPDVVMGHAESDVASTALDGVAAILWIPDPEQRHGWREVYVKRMVATPRKAVGFRKA